MGSFAGRGRRRPTVENPAPGRSAAGGIRILYLKRYAPCGLFSGEIRRTALPKRQGRVYGNKQHQENTLLNR